MRTRALLDSLFYFSFFHSILSYHTWFLEVSTTDLIPDTDTDTGMEEDEKGNEWIGVFVFLMSSR